MRWAMNVTRIEEVENVYMILVGRPEWNWPTEET
jgi:hypothetical protein